MNPVANPNLGLRGFGHSLGQEGIWERKLRALILRVELDHKYT